MTNPQPAEKTIEQQLDTILRITREHVIGALPAVQMLLGANGLYAQLAAVPEADLDAPFGESRWSARRWGEILEALGSASGTVGLAGWINTPLAGCGKTPLQIIGTLD